MYDIQDLVAVVRARHLARICVLAPGKPQESPVNWSPYKHVLSLSVGVIASSILPLLALIIASSHTSDLVSASRVNTRRIK